jgi:hypothetical protein
MKWSASLINKAEKVIALIYCIAVISINAYSQNPPFSCDTLILGNNRSLFVYIDSISSSRVYYKKRNDAGDKTYNISLTNVAKINKGGLPIAQSESPQLAKESFDKKRKTPKPGWNFQHHLGKKDIHLKQGQRIRIKHLNNDTIRLQKGRLHTINDSTLILKSKSGSLVDIPKEAIRELIIIRGLGPWANALGIILIVSTLLTFAMLGISDGIGEGIGNSISMVFPNANAGSSNSRKSNLKKGCLTILIGLAIGFGLVISSSSIKITSPFSDKWKVYQTNQIQASSPANQEP